MGKIKLKPCPWCGVVPEVIEYTKNNLYIECRTESCWVRPVFDCLHCPDHITGFPSAMQPGKNDMIKIWNDRKVKD